MKYLLKLFLVVSIGFMLTSCLSPVKTKPENAYLLNLVPSVPTYRPRGITLMVMQSDSVPAYNTSQMAYSMVPYQIAYYDRNRWADTPSQMLQPLIVQTLQNSRYFRAVVTPPLMVGRYEYVLNTQVLQILQDYTHRPVLLRLKINAQLVRVASNQVIATKQFVITEPMRQYSPYGGVMAANRASAEFLEELTRFCIRSIK